MTDHAGSPSPLLATLAAIDEAFPPTMMTVRDDSVRLWRLEEKSRQMGEYVASLERRIAELETR